MAAPVLPNPDALAVLAAPPVAPRVAPSVAPPVIPPGPAQPAPGSPRWSRSSSASGARSTRRGWLHHVFFSFSLVSSRLSPFLSIVACQFTRQFLFLFYISSCVLLNLVLCCPFDRLLLFALRASVFSVSRVFGCYKSLAMCSAVTNVWPCVQLLQMFGRVFGCYKSWACAGLLEVSGRVFGGYKGFVACSACSLVVGRVFGVTSLWPCVRRLQFSAVLLAVTSVGRAFGRFKCWSVPVLLFSSFFYFYAFLPVSGFAHSFFPLVPSFSSWDLPFCSCMFFLTLTYFLGRSLFFYIRCVLILLCFLWDFFVFFCFPRSLGVCL